jgi:hypothetical protein
MARLFLFTKGCKTLKSSPLASQSTENLTCFMGQPHFTRQKCLEAVNSVGKESGKAGKSITAKCRKS